MAYTEIYVDPSRQTRTACTITNSTTTATVTLNSHGYSNSDTVKIQGANETAYNGNFVISNVTTNTFDYTMPSDPGGSATGSPLASKLNLSGVDGNSDANAYPDLQYALDTHSQNTANTNRFNIKAGVSEILTKTISPANFGPGSVNYHTQYEGYTSTAGDGGIATISGNNGNFTMYGVSSTNAYYADWKNLRLIDFGIGVVFGRYAYYGSAFNCEMSGSSCSAASNTPSAFSCIQCYIHNMSSTIATQNMSHSYCFVKHDATSGACVDIDNNMDVFNNNFILAEGDTVRGITVNNVDASRVYQNSILRIGTQSGQGIFLSRCYGGFIANNLIENFGNAFAIYNYTYGAGFYNNSYYNCTNGLSGAGDNQQFNNTELLSESPFKKTGSLPTDFTSATFWDDVYAYFEPVGTGGVVNGGIGGKTRGATETSGAGGGLLRVGLGGGISG